MTDLTERERQIVEWLRGESDKMLRLIVSSDRITDTYYRCHMLARLANAIEAGEPWKGKDDE